MAEGVLDRHILGPFTAEESLYGPYGVSSCSGSSIWDDAAALIDAVWPVLAGLNRRTLPCRLECAPSPYGREATGFDRGGYSGLPDILRKVEAERRLKGKKRTMEWRKERAKAKRRGEIHFRNRKTFFDDDILF